MKILRIEDGDWILRVVLVKSGYLKIQQYTKNIKREICLSVYEAKKLKEFLNKELEDE